MTSECWVKRIICKTWTGFSAGTCTNSADPDQTPQNAASDQGLHCSLKLQEVLLNYRKLRVKWNSLKSPFIFPAYIQWQSTHQCCQYFYYITVHEQPQLNRICNFRLMDAFLASNGSPLRNMFEFSTVCNKYVFAGKATRLSTNSVITLSTKSLITYNFFNTAQRQSNPSSLPESVPGKGETNRRKNGRCSCYMQNTSFWLLSDPSDDRKYLFTVQTLTSHFVIVWWKDHFMLRLSTKNWILLVKHDIFWRWANVYGQSSSYER